MISNLSRSHLRLYALCGVIAPIFFVLMVIVEGLLVPGYSHMSQQVSDLGAYALYGSYALLQNLNFCVFGILVVAFAIGLGHELPASRAITTSLCLFGALFFPVGLLPRRTHPMARSGTLPNRLGRRRFDSPQRVLCVEKTSSPNR